MKNRLIISALCMLLSIGLWAQGDIRKELFSAEKVMEHRQDIGLKPNQADAIKKIHNESAGAFQTLKWDLDYEQQLLDSLVAMNQPDTKKVSQQFDKVMALEKELKKMRMMSLIGIKNVLEPEQIEKLKEVNDIIVFGTTNFKALKLKIPAKGTTVKGLRNNNKFGVKFVGDEIRDGKEAPLFYLNEGGKLIEYKRDISTINMQDVENIEVLKGKSAIEKVGSRGANGIIIITKKQ